MTNAKILTASILKVEKIFNYILEYIYIEKADL